MEQAARSAIDRPAMNKEAFFAKGEIEALVRERRDFHLHKAPTLVSTLKQAEPSPDIGDMWLWISPPNLAPEGRKFWNLGAMWWQVTTEDGSVKDVPGVLLMLSRKEANKFTRRSRAEMRSMYVSGEIEFQPQAPLILQIMRNLHSLQSR